MSPAVRKKRRTATATAALFSAEVTTIPLLPNSIGEPGKYRAQWTAHDLKAVFAMARELLGAADGKKANDFIGSVHHARLCYFSDSLRLTGKAANSKKLSKWMNATGVWPLLRRLNNDTWREWLIMDNAVAFWQTPEQGQLPKVVILDCEILSYSNRLGHEVLKVKLKQQKLSDEEKTAMGERWAKAYEKGEEVTLDLGQGENFKVLTWEKLGKGLGMPRIKEVLELLSTRQLLQAADWAGAWESVNVTEQWNCGHEIKQGPNAGKPTHFITKKKQDEMEKGLKGKRGGRRIVTNFDAKLSYKYLDPAFFDPKKYAGVMAQLKAWGGAPVAMAESGTISPMFMQSFAAEGMKSREMVGDFLAEIVNDPTFFGGLNKPDEPITLGWNPYSFLETKTMLELLRLAGANAWCSPQTARTVLGFDNDVEGDLLKEAHKNPERYRPPFEAKQGMGGANGRPPKNVPAPEA